MRFLDSSGGCVGLPELVPALLVARVESRRGLEVGQSVCVAPTCGQQPTVFDDELDHQAGDGRWVGGRQLCQKRPGEGLQCGRGARQIAALILGLSELQCHGRALTDPTLQQLHGFRRLSYCGVCVGQRTPHIQLHLRGRILRQRFERRQSAVGIGLVE